MDLNISKMAKTSYFTHNYLYITTASQFNILNINNLNTPPLWGHLDTAYAMNNLVISGQIAYMSDPSHGIYLHLSILWNFPRLSMLPLMIIRTFHQEGFWSIRAPVRFERLNRVRSFRSLSIKTSRPFGWT